MEMLIYLIGKTALLKYGKVDGDTILTQLIYWYDFTGKLLGTLYRP